MRLRAALDGMCIMFTTIFCSGWVRYGSCECMTECHYLQGCPCTCLLFLPKLAVRVSCDAICGQHGCQLCFISFQFVFVSYIAKFSKSVMFIVFKVWSPAIKLRLKFSLHWASYISVCHPQHNCYMKGFKLPVYKHLAH